MKKVITTIVLGVFFIMNAAAQDRFIDHLAIGIHCGSIGFGGDGIRGYIPVASQTGGVGLHVTAQFNDWLEARAGVSTTLGNKGSRTVNVEGVPGGKYVSANIDVFSRYQVISGDLFFDFYPFKKVPVHFTAGAYIGSGSPLVVYGRTPIPEALASYNTGVAEISGLAIPTNMDGKIAARLRMPVVKPCVGVGISTGRLSSNRVVFSANVACMYKDNNGITIEDPDGNDVEVGYWRSNHFMLRLATWNKKCIVTPVITLRLAFRIF